MQLLRNAVKVGKIKVDDDILVKHGDLLYCISEDYTGHKSVRVWEQGLTSTGNMTILSRLIMFPPDHLEVDHIDRDGTNCRRVNLRIATPSQNAANRISARKSKSGYKGVYAKHGLFQASVRVNHRLNYLGSYVTAEEAAHVYDAAAVKAFGEFAVLNFPKGDSITT